MSISPTPLEPVAGSSPGFGVVGVGSVGTGPVGGGGVVGGVVANGTCTSLEVTSGSAAPPGTVPRTDATLVTRPALASAAVTV